MDSHSTGDDNTGSTHTSANDDAAVAASATTWKSDPWPITTQPAGSSMFDPLQSQSQSQGQYDSQYSSSNYSYQSPRSRGSRPVWISVVLLVLALARLLSHFAGSSNSSSYDTSTYGTDSTYSTDSPFLTDPTDPTDLTNLNYVVPGVSVCDLENVTLSPIGCSGGEDSAGLKSSAMLCYSALDGATFADTSVTFAVQELNAKGKVAAHGTSIDSVVPGDTSSCTDLTDVIRNAKLPLVSGKYVVDATDGGVDLGSDKFTLTSGSV
jgi:hypothetical protein